MAVLEPKKAHMKNVRPNVDAARLGFLHGNGDGKPIRDVMKLAETFDVHPHTIRKWMPTWQKELEQNVISTNCNSLALSLSREIQEKVNADTLIIREQTDLLIAQMEANKSVLNTLLGICKELDITTDNGDYALRIYENFVSGFGAQFNLQKQYLTLQKRWCEIAGVDSFTDVQVAGARALVTAQAKLSAKTAENQDETKAVPNQSVFLD